MNVFEQQQQKSATNGSMINQIWTHCLNDGGKIAYKPLLCSMKRRVFKEERIHSGAEACAIA